MEQDMPGDSQFPGDRRDQEKFAIRNELSVDAALRWSLLHHTKPMPGQGLEKVLDRGGPTLRTQQQPHTAEKSYQGMPANPHSSAVNGVAQRCRVSLLNGGSQR